MLLEFTQGFEFEQIGVEVSPDDLLNPFEVVVLLNWLRLWLHPCSRLLLCLSPHEWQFLHNLLVWLRLEKVHHVFRRAKLGLGQLAFFSLKSFVPFDEVLATFFLYVHLSLSFNID